MSVESNPAPKPHESRRHAPARPISGRLFYPGAAARLLVLTLAGFQRYYVHGRSPSGRDAVPPLSILMHATVKTAWIVLFLVQPLLIANRYYRTHMAVGRCGAILAACVVVLALWVGIQTTRLKPPDFFLWGATPRQFMVVPVLTSVIFGVFGGFGVYHRRRPDVHGPMMLMGTLVHGIAQEPYSADSLHDRIAPHWEPWR